MIARESFEKSLPRLASAAPFLCLIEDHLLCPDTRLLSHQVQKPLVHARVVGQLRVERREQEATVTDEHRLAIVLREHLDVGADLAHAWRPDENAAQLVFIPLDVEVGLEARDLAPVGVSVDDEIDETQVVAVEHDHPSACAEHGSLEAADRLVEPVEPHQAHERRRLAAGNDEPVEPVELLRLAHLEDVCPESAQHRHVLAEVPLEGEDADLHGSILPTEFARRRRSAIRRWSRASPGWRGTKRSSHTWEERRGREGTTGSPASYQPRVSSSCDGSSEAVEMPTIGSPSPAETSASTFGSLKWVVASTIAFARVSGFPDLKMPEPTKTPSAPSCMQSAASAGVAIPPAVNVTTGRRPFSATQRTSS